MSEYIMLNILHCLRLVFEQLAVSHCIFYAGYPILFTIFELWDKKSAKKFLDVCCLLLVFCPHKKPCLQHFYDRFILIFACKLY